MADPQNGNQPRELFALFLFVASQVRFVDLPHGTDSSQNPLLAKWKWSESRPVQYQGSRDSLPRSPPRMAESVEVTNCDCHTTDSESKSESESESLATAPFQDSSWAWMQVLATATATPSRLLGFYAFGEVQIKRICDCVQIGNFQFKHSHWWGRHKGVPGQTILHKTK